MLDVPVPDITPKTANLCIGDIETYSTNYNSDNEYYWTVTGGAADCTGCDAWIDVEAEITVEWTTTGNRTITVIERVKDSDPVVSGTTSQGYVIYPQPSPFNLSASPVCSGSSADVEVDVSEVGTTYQLRLHPDNTPVGGSYAGNGDPLPLPTGAITTTTTYNVRAYNLGCELVSNPIEVTVYALPTLTLDNVGGEVCDGDPAGLKITFSSSTAVYTIRIYDDGDEHDDSPLDQESAPSSPHTFAPNMVWTGPAASNVHPFTAVIIDDNGCESVPVAPVEVTVWKIPETGPQYHIPNDHGL